MTTQTENKKPKVQKTNRIKWRKCTTLYVSSHVIREVREHLERGHQCYLVKKDHLDELGAKLRALATDPNTSDHFTNSAKEILYV